MLRPVLTTPHTLRRMPQVRMIWRDSRSALAQPASGCLVNPHHLDRFKDFLAGTGRIITKPRQRTHPLMQISEAHRERIQVRMRLAQGNGDIA